MNNFMYNLSPTFKQQELYKCSNLDEYLLYKAALEWNLIDPIIIRKEEDVKSRDEWRNLVEPYSHQVSNLITFCKRLPVTLLADDVGLGKTISAGLVASELIARGRVTKILVVCPKLLIPQWQEELKSKFNIDSISAIGQELIEARPPNNIGAVVTTYHSARIYLTVISRAGFEMLILDEAHKLRNLYGVLKQPDVAVRFRNALKDRLFKYVLMLTATPIQNRLWDIYSLVELLSVARGHENPFGSEVMFAKKFIEDSKNEARKLKSESIDAFRSIVYGYMSRTRRKDVSLLFPERHVLLHRVKPKREELEILEALAQPIQKLNRLLQISILQAFVSSPHALSLQLDNSARKGTLPTELALQVRNIVKRMNSTAKQEGLVELINNLKIEQGENWRAVVFTERRETQTTIEAYLSDYGIKCGLINGDSGFRNQDTISKFRKVPPEFNVIISTRAGSEGVNLQAANVLVNYDLPWNPMIVEQRIGRIQRLASEYKNVSIYNIILENTFEEYIVGRLMEKLQMASSAIGDIEALLEAAGMDDDDDSKGFEEKIRELVIASLAGQDVEKATRLAEESIFKAKEKLKEEATNIERMLGGSNNAIDLGPKSPELPDIQRSIPAKDFAIMALQSLGAKINDNNNIYTIEHEGRKEFIKFENEAGDQYITLCKPGSPFFDKLVSRITATSLHNVEDADIDLINTLKIISANWVKNFNGKYIQTEIEKFTLNFEGTVVLNVRITNTHDGYERLLELDYKSKGNAVEDIHLFENNENYINNLSLLGISVAELQKKTMNDKGVSEFCRFYLERLQDELKAAQDDKEKEKKLKEDFTPNIDITLVGLEGIVYRDIIVKVTYEVDSVKYESNLNVIPYFEKIIKEPEFILCKLTNNKFPVNCINKCSISGKYALVHKLFRSELSSNFALPEYSVTCTLSGKKVLIDEVVISDLTGNYVIEEMMLKSDFSGKKAEPDFFEKCEFTGTNLLKTELKSSQISGKLYRYDEELESVVSGKTGHKSEFIYCQISQKPLLKTESEKCEISGKFVKPGILEKCSVSGKKVLTEFLNKSSVSGKKALSGYFVTCHTTGESLLEAESEKCEITGYYVKPGILKQCSVSNKYVLPELLGRSSISGRYALKEYIIDCYVTSDPILEVESEKCEISGNNVKPGILGKCSISNKSVLSEFLDISSLSGRKALKEYFIESSISGIKMLEEEAVKSSTGLFCSPEETKPCIWSGINYHPDDLKNCHLTKLNYHYKFIDHNNSFTVLSELLQGINHSDSKSDIWTQIEQKVSRVTGKSNYKVINAQLSIDGKKLACCTISKNLMGLKVRFSGFLYSIDENNIIGIICSGKRNNNEWTESK